MMAAPFLLDTAGRLLVALPVTLGLLAVSAVLATALAAALTACSAARSPVLRWGQRGWTFVFRGTPLILQIFMIYYGLAMLPAIRHGALWVAFREPMFCLCLALTCCCSAYIGEVFRGALRAVPPGEIEAARAAGMTPFQIVRRVTAPALIRVALPSYANEIVMMAKSTSLASTITILDMTGVAQTVIAHSYRTMEVFLCAAAFYLILNAALAGGFRLLADRLHAPRPTTAIPEPL